MEHSYGGNPAAFCGVAWFLLQLNSLFNFKMKLIFLYMFYQNLSVMLKKDKYEGELFEFIPPRTFCL